MKDKSLKILLGVIAVNLTLQTINQIGLEGLYRIYNKEFGFECIGLDEDLLYIGFVEQKALRIPIVHSVTSQLDLR